MGKEKLCKLAKDIKDNLEEYTELVHKAKYICTKCGRAAKSENNLCHPKKLKNSSK